MKVLQLTVHYSPNLGGVETHLLDLIRELVKRKHQIFVLTYRPLSVKAAWRVREKQPGIDILRLPWLPGLFNKLSAYPMWEFLYLFPGLFLALPFVLIAFRPNVIHAHGLVAGCVGVFWGRLFGVRTVISTHSIYHFPPSGLYRWAAKTILTWADQNLCLSNQSKNELTALGVPKEKVGRFVYWVDLQKFKPLNKLKCKKELGWSGQFVVFFLGRLVPEKGIPELLRAVKLFKKGIRLVIAGSGPLESAAKNYYIGRVSQDQLPIYYNAADLVIVPSTHEEGFGRIIIESLACGTPIIAANRGAIPEAMDDSVGKLIFITPENIATAVNDFFLHRDQLITRTNKSRVLAERRYSETNIEPIMSSYYNG